MNVTGKLFALTMRAAVLDPNLRLRIEDSDRLGDVGQVRVMRGDIGNVILSFEGEDGEVIGREMVDAMYDHVTLPISVVNGIPVHLTFEDEARHKAVIEIDREGDLVYKVVEI